MSRRFLISSLCTVFLLQLIAAFLIWHERLANPIVQGRPLQSWIENFEIWNWPPNKPVGDLLEQNLPQTDHLLEPMLRKREHRLTTQWRQWLAVHHLARADTKTVED